MKTIRWAVIGVGRFGRIHAEVISGLPGCELAAIANRNGGILAEAAAELEVRQAETDFRAILADPSIDAVSVTTHFEDHHAVALAALKSGKHVLLEKPMAATSEECRELLAAADAAPGVFMVGHVCRFDPRATLAKEAIDAGRIGRIVSMHARRNLPKAPGSVRLDKISPLVGDGIHDADLMMWFLGRAPDEIYARNVRVERFRFPDLGWAMLHFGEDAVGVIETVWCLPTSVPTVIDAKMEIVGTKGKLSIDAADTGLTVTDENGPRQPDTVYWPKQYGRREGALAREIEYFCRCVRSGEPPLLMPPREAARALAVMEAAERSAEARAPVPFHF